MRTSLLTWLLLLFVAAIIAACGADDSTGGGPRILDVSVSSARLTPGQSVTVTVVVQPQDDATPVTSGQLRRGPLSLGTFAMSAPNTFTVTTSWEQLAGTDLGGQMGEPVAAPATVLIYDEAGASAEQIVMIDLACTSAAAAVCNGGCIDVTADHANCGGCGNDCTDDLDGTTTSMRCVNATCGTVTPMQGQRGSCDQICSQATYHGKALACANECLVTGTNSLAFSFGTGSQPGWAYYKNQPFTQSTLYDMTSCEDVPVPSFDDLVFSWERCCCVAEL